MPDKTVETKVETETETKTEKGKVETRDRAPVTREVDDGNGDKVFASLTFFGNKKGGRGGWSGNNHLMYEGSVAGFNRLAPDRAYLTAGAAESTEATDYSWLWKALLVLLVGVVVVLLTIFLVREFGGDSKVPMMPGTTSTTTTTSFVPAVMPAPQVIAVKGINGRDGRDGKDGSDGLPGCDGDIGPEGPEGSQGPQGEPGEDGADGKNGRNGKSGADGTPGAQGTPGADGKNGIDAGPVIIEVIGGRIEADVE